MEILNAISDRLKNVDNTVVRTEPKSPPPVLKNGNGQKQADILSKFENTTHKNTVFHQRWDSNFRNDLFKNIAIELIRLDAQHIVIETTLDESLLIKSDLQEKRLYIELFFIDEKPSYDVVINIYSNQNHIFGTAGIAKTVFPKVHKFLL